MDVEAFPQDQGNVIWIGKYLSSILMVASGAWNIFSAREV